MGSVRLLCPAKINAFLAVTGRREDGFHDLVSLVLPLDWGDELEAEVLPDRAGHLEIECDDPQVPRGPDNLIWRAAEAFVGATGSGNGYRFRLVKRIPMGAGLGGGSSDAVAALRAMNRLEVEPLGKEDLRRLAAGLGSDCPLFLHDGPVVIRGRGERIEEVPAAFREAVKEWRILVFKPVFSIGTAWAYGELVRAGPGACKAPAAAEATLGSILTDPDSLADLGFNSFESVVGGKFPAIPLLLQRLADEGAWLSRMSGSGSACFSVGRSRSELDRVRETVQDCWGAHGLLEEVGIRRFGIRDGCLDPGLPAVG